MKNHILKNYICVLVVAALSASAQAASLLPAGANDQVPTALAAPHAKALTATLDRVPVRVSHALDSKSALDTAPAPYAAQSREFWSDVGETELRSGVRFNTTAPGAVVRLSPQCCANAALYPAGGLVRANGRTLSAGEASMAVADAKALRSAGMAVPEGTLAFRLAGATSGEVEIAAPHAQGRYLVHVFEPASALVLSLTADRDTVLAGTRLTFRTGVTGANLKLASGIVNAPDGFSADLAFTRNADGTFSATFTPDAAHRNGPQLWEAHVFTASSSGQSNVLRDATTAFAVSEATARFAGSAQFEQRADGLRVTFDVATAAASRYQVSAVLYGTGADGALHAAALAQSAAWVSGSRGNIELGFDAATLSGLHAPYELRDLRLLDQASMALIERRERGLRID